MLYTILIGLVAGVIAKFLMPGKDPGGLIITILLGIGGSLLATYLGQALNIYGPGEGARLIGSVVGAFIILFAYRLFTKKR
ncbi:GlsB/YeaQ/YmgE family stress response membrane protein [bacterium]|nr:MAG: GlsB/YeaQ/YmgE family stress response membrane protein [candidate division KSB1 bacterium]MCE7940237.1 GlsB/YeaQ/YmgE family stress response membrane protein [Chlorobi bacterium CHB1]MCL4708269.1 GlsB/YeaQ/YmgE family stress response membrane protein [bacterium]MDL1877455.1 GlsB/YeaQ/YmgE family stress response membrane protein [Cytophagia bacterium CHB2]MBC6950030.1 GlsB/YeaQ/YmgE family stress response membrane protein [candidate division KSB1 bacterium]